MAMPPAIVLDRGCVITQSNFKRLFGVQEVNVPRPSDNQCETDDTIRLGAISGLFLDSRWTLGRLRPSPIFDEINSWHVMCWTQDVRADLRSQRRRCCIRGEIECFQSHIARYGSDEGWLLRDTSPRIEH